MIGETEMAATANPDAITRTEFKSAMQRVDSRLVALESGASRAADAVNESGQAYGPLQFEVVTQNEFRLFKWLGAFALTAVVGGFGFLHQQLDRGFEAVRVEMKGLHTQFGELRQEVGGLRQEMEAEFAITRSEIHRNREDIGKLREDVGALRERVVRIETLLSGEGRGSPS